LKDEWQEPADERWRRYLVPILLLFLGNRSQKLPKMRLAGRKNGAPWFFCNTQRLPAPDIPLFFAPLDFEREKK